MQAQSSCGCFIAHSSHSHALNLNTQSQTSKPPSLPPTFGSLSRTSPLHLRLQILTCNRNGTRPSTPYRLKCLSVSSRTTTRTKSRDFEERPISSTDYLVSSLDLSPESSLKITRHILLNSTSNADAVLALFEDYGFGPTHMLRIFSAHPKLLSYDPDKTLKPKLDFFHQNGVSGDALVRAVTSDPAILKTRLDRITLGFSFLRSLFGGDNQAVVDLFSDKSMRVTSLLRMFRESCYSNVQTLKRFGVSDSNIVKMLFLDFSSSGVVSRDPDEFRQGVREILEMGSDPSSPMFVRALNALLGRNKEKLESNKKLLKESLGWTDEDVKAVFVKDPKVLCLGEERLKKGLELFLNRIGWMPDDIAKNPSQLYSSYEKKILPRFAVLEILMSKGLVTKSCLGNAFKTPESRFLSRYVKKYEEEMPHLLEVYQEKMENCKY